MNATLAIDTSTKNGRISVLSGNNIIFNEVFTSERSHNSQIFSPLKEALMSCNHAPSLIVVGTGPGSYTGIRIGIAAGLGLSMALDVPIIGIPSICGAESTDHNSSYHVIGDARRESLYIATVKGHQIISGPELFESVESIEGKVEIEKEQILTFDETLSFSGIEKTNTCAQKLARIAAKLSDEEINELRSVPPEPIYLRAPFITQPKK
ncbi:MAG: tRNA (adenosine(37)-N6)-threonylcarbamoyltransferase complex dimerization subunit type 1 TsaB [Verrucomicrobiota bacterium]|nr:tRNA (adenosine(37)-N6)-threonylcarbamoyltransferase complex dimerization subunit type 1 TsaB [Verrucomicrobiota bacterium]